MGLWTILLMAGMAESTNNLFLKDQFQSVREKKIEDPICVWEKQADTDKALPKGT